MDEAMVKYKGHTSLKQYMPMKPIKRGIKMWCSTDSHSGYLCDFNIYTGHHRDGVEKCGLLCCYPPLQGNQGKVVRILL